MKRKTAIVPIILVLFVTVFTSCQTGETTFKPDSTPLDRVDARFESTYDQLFSELPLVGTKIFYTDPEYASILKKYKEYNGPDGNSPESQGDGGVYSGNSRQPNAEDLNDDNTLSEGERYFQYI